MKYLCTGCNRLLDVERFRIDEGVLVITCAQCGAQTRAGAQVNVTEPALKPRTVSAEAVVMAASAADEQAFEVPVGHCPKCISRRSADTLACPSCGLVFAQASGTFNPSEWLKGRWLSLLQQWGDADGHEALRAEALARGELAELGRLYRIRLAVQRQDPYAKRGLDEVLRLAVLPQLQQRERNVHSASAAPKWKYAVLTALIGASLLAMFILMRQLLTLA